LDVTTAAARLPTMWEVGGAEGGAEGDAGWGDPHTQSPISPGLA